MLETHKHTTFAFDISITAVRQKKPNPTVQVVSCYYDISWYNVVLKSILPISHSNHYRILSIYTGYINSLTNCYYISDCINIVIARVHCIRIIGFPVFVMFGIRLYIGFRCPRLVMFEWKIKVSFSAIYHDLMPITLQQYRLTIA